MSFCTGDLVSPPRFETPLDAEICPNEPPLTRGPVRPACHEQPQVPIGPASPPDQFAATLHRQSIVQYPRG